MISLSAIFRQTPLFYGVAYLALIPIYATIYFLFSSIIGEERSYIECIYFSTVTITTLGYGDITPIGATGQLVTASESLLGVVSIGLFLNAIASARGDAVRKKQTKREANVYRESQRARLNGHYSLIGPLIARYRQSVIEITQPAGSQSSHYNPNFKLRDMKDMYKPTRLLREPYLRPAIRGYFEALEDLHREISDLIKSVDLRCFPDIETYCLALVNVIAGFDYSGAILSAIDTTAGEKTLAERASEMLAKHDGNYQLQDGSLLNGYILLCHQIKIAMENLSHLEVAVKSEMGLGGLP